MLRRNLLKSLTAIIPISLLSKNVNANLLQKNYKEMNDDFENESNLNKLDYNCPWDIVIRNKDGNPIKAKRFDGYCFENTYDKQGRILTHKDSIGLFYEFEYDKNGIQHTVTHILP